MFKTVQKGIFTYLENIKENSGEIYQQKPMGQKTFLPQE